MPHRNRKIIIGVSGYSPHTQSVRAMMNHIHASGGNAVFLSSRVLHLKSAVKRDIARIDALVLMGNNYDIDPKEYIHRYPASDPRAVVHPMTRSEMDMPASKARARYETEILAQAMYMGMPILGICGGMQRINIYCGGNLHQHLPDLVGCDKHMQCKNGIAPHIPVIPIVIKGGTQLACIARNIKMPFCKDYPQDGLKVIMENSLHHQAIDYVGAGLRVCAMTDSVRMRDGTCGFLAEAIESDPDGPYKDQFILGVQWHPEFGASSLGDHIVRRLIDVAKVNHISHSSIAKRNTLNRKTKSNYQTTLIDNPASNP